MVVLTVARPASGSPAKAAVVSSATAGWWWMLLAGLCCLAGFAVRASGLGAQSVWLDEGATFYFARMPLAAMLAATFHSEPNPPLYYLLEHLWLNSVGTSEFALRFPSVLAGVLVIALTYRLGKDLFGPAAAAGAAALASASAYLIWYAQEARAFSLLCCAAMATFLLCERACRRPSWRRWLTFGVLLALTLYSHFYGVFVLLVTAVLVLVLALRRPDVRRTWPRWAVAFGGASLLYLPWVGAMLRAGAASASWRPPASLSSIALQTVSAFVDEGVWAPKGDTALVVGELVLAAGGVAWCLSRRKALTAWLLPLGLVVPTLAVAALSVRAPIFATSYVIAQAPLFYVAVAAGIAIGWRRVPWLAMAVCLALVAASGMAAVEVRHDQRFRKEDFRTAAQYLEQRAGADDLIVLQAEYARLPFAYYYYGPTRVLPFAASPGQAEQTLAPALAGKDVAWLLLSHADQADPRGQVRAWLDGHYPLATTAFPQGIQLYAYRVDYRRADLPSGVTAVQRRFGPAVELVGYQAFDGIPATDARLHPPSNWLHVVLYWKALAPITTTYRSSVQMADQRGVWGDELARPTDALAFAAARHWQAGEIVVEDVDINLNPSTPPGRYDLDVRLMGSNGQTVAMVGGDANVGTVQIVAP